jgi:hypothetical protein
LVHQFEVRIDRLSGGTAGHGHGHVMPDEEWLTPEDLDVWRQLLDPDGPYFLGNRADLAVLSVRSIHVGHAPR